MIKFILYLVSFLFSLVLFSQEKEREVIRGKIIADSLEVENITIYNISSNTGAVSDFDGKFSIKVREKDTLVFKALSYNSQHYIITESDLLVEEFTIKLEEKINELNEVIITPSSLTGIIEVDTKRIKVYAPDLSGVDYSKLQFKDDQYSKVSNPLENQGFSPLTGINFGMIFSMFVSEEKKQAAKRKRREEAYNKKWLREVQSQSFYEHVMRKYSHNFITTNLKIKNEDIVSFIAFADPGSFELAEFLEPENEMKFVEYLIQKANEFNSNKNNIIDTNNNDEKK